jgi:hypothetical protein
MRTTWSSASALRYAAPSSGGSGLSRRDAADVGELDRRGHVFPRIEERRQSVEAFVRDPRHAHVGFLTTCTPWGVPGAGQELKESGLAR